MLVEKPDWFAARTKWFHWKLRYSKLHFYAFFIYEDLIRLLIAEQISEEFNVLAVFGAQTKINIINIINIVFKFLTQFIETLDLQKPKDFK